MLRALAIVIVLFAASAARAQDSAPVIPDFWDAQERLTKPSLSPLPRLRFLTVTDFPPFSYIDSRQRLAGFHVDLAREICREIDLLPVCQIQAVPLAQLQGELTAGNGEAVMAGLAPRPELRETLAFSRPYFRLPARFLVHADRKVAEPIIDNLAGKDVAIVDGTAHAAFARAWFADARLRLFASRRAALEALDKGEVAALFDDALALSFAIQANPKRVFAGGPYLAPEFFASDLSVAVAADDEDLLEAIDYALRRISDSGKFAELYLRYFPIGLY